MNRFFSSLQIKFLIVFSIVFAITLASTGIYLKYSANFAIRNVGDSIEQTRAKQVENIISELYLQQDWDDLQNTVEQLGILTDQQIIVTNSQGQIVADSQNLNFESKLKVRRLKQREANISRKKTDNRKNNKNILPKQDELITAIKQKVESGLITQEEANSWMPPQIRRNPITIDLVNNVSEIGHVRILPLERLQLATDNSIKTFIKIRPPLNFSS